MLADDAGDQELVKHGESLAAAYLTEPSSVDPALAAAALRISALHGDAARFTAFRQRFETAAVPVDRQRLLQALGDFRDDRLTDQAIAYVLTGPLRPQEIFVIPRVVAMGALKNENRAFEWMTANYDAIVDRIPPEQGAYLARFADGCSLERLEAAQRFFASVREKEAARGITGTERELAKVADSVRNCVSLRDREGAAVVKFLEA
jgi:alanyl aminopeptidase